MVEVIAILNNYLTGFAHRTTAWEQIRQRAGLTDKECERRLGQYLVHARQTAPQLAVDIESRLHLTSDRSFLLGLDCLLDGIAARFALAPPAAPVPDEVGQSGDSGTVIFAVEDC